MKQHVYTILHELFAQVDYRRANAVGNNKSGIHALWNIYHLEPVVKEEGAYIAKEKWEANGEAELILRQDISNYDLG